MLDEAQTIPLHVLRPCLAAINELARNYGCTVVLCTATQPAITLPHFNGGLDIPGARELAPDPAALHKRLKRVTIRRAGVLTDEDVLDQLAAVEQGLVIVNTRGHAVALFKVAKERAFPGIIHLTTRQYGAKLQRILAEVRQRLDPQAPQPCRLITTSLVEAGVDLDFARVWRADAGLDSIIRGGVDRNYRDVPEWPAQCG